MAPKQRNEETSAGDEPPELVEIQLVIEHVPTLKLRCPCGYAFETTAKPAIRAAQRGDLPPVPCPKCATPLRVRRRLIMTPQEVARARAG